MEDVIEDAIEKAYWEFDAMHRGLNEWGQTPLSERDAFKRVCRNLAAGAFPVTREIIDFMAENAQLKAALELTVSSRGAILDHMDWYGKWGTWCARLTKELAHLKAELAQVKRSYDGAVAAHHEAKSQYRTLIEARRRELAGWEAAHAALNRENDQLKAELAQAKRAEQHIREHEFKWGYQEAERKCQVREQDLAQPSPLQVVPSTATGGTQYGAAQGDRHMTDEELDPLLKLDAISQEYGNYDYGLPVHLCTMKTLEESQRQTRDQMLAVIREVRLAGYRAGLEEAKAMLKESEGDIDLFLFTLEAKLKQQP